MDSGHVPPRRNVPAKAESLFRLFERKLMDLFANRQARLDRQRIMLEKFLDQDFIVDQSALRFVP